MVNRYWILILSLMLCGVWHGSALALTVEAIAGQDQIAIGESLQFQLRLDGSPDSDPDLSPLDKNWEIISRSQSSQMQIINGSISRSTVYSFTLMPRGEGPLTIPAVCFDKDCSLPVTVEVSNSATPEAPEHDQVILETEVNSQKIMALGQLLLKVRLLLKVGLPVGQISEPQPTGIDALVNVLGTEVRKHERRNGRVYQVIERNYAIFPQESGVLQIPALQYDGMVPGNRTRFDPFGRQGMLIRRTSQPREIEVLPLPSDLGQRPWIPSTGVSLQDNWQQQRPKLVVGEPATRTLRLSAAGVLSAQLPELKPDAPETFKVYFDQPSRKDQRGHNGTTGVLEQQITLIPTRAGHYRLPAVDLDWWDMSTNSWRVAHLGVLELEVAPAVAAAVTPPATPQDPVLMNEGAKDMIQDVADQSPPAPPVEQTVVTGGGFWPWLSLGLALGWVLTLVVLLRKVRDTKEPVAGKIKDVQPDEKTARRTVMQAAHNHDPQAARQALVLWSQLLWPELPGSRYEYLFKVSDPGLRKELEALDFHLYGDCSQPWDGQQLADRIAEWRQVATSRNGSELPELYPDNSALNN